MEENINKLPIGLPVVELFHSIQGEGVYAGVPSIFVRVTGCNLRCVFKDSICDTSYTSFNPEKPIFRDLDELATAIHELSLKFPKTKHLVITGGEPMLYKEGIMALLDGISYLDFHVTVETNGTLGIIEDLDGDFNYIDLYSVSPKLSTSVDKERKFLTRARAARHDKARINYESLADFFIHPNRSQVQLKFVYSGKDSVKEIKKIIMHLVEDFKCEITADDVLLMPEGVTTEQLKQNQEECAIVCMENGWRFCDRLHIRIWEDKKCV